MSKASAQWLSLGADSGLRLLLVRVVNDRGGWPGPSGRMNQVLGAPLFRVLCERVGGGASSLGSIILEVAV
jgi:hypothetical protein